MWNTQIPWLEIRNFKTKVKCPLELGFHGITWPRAQRNGEIPGEAGHPPRCQRPLTDYWWKNRFRDWKILFLSLVLVCLATFCLQQVYFFCLPSTGDDSSSGRWLLSSADDGAAAAAAHPSVALYIFPRTAPPFCTRIGHRHYRITPSIHQGKIDKFANCVCCLDSQSQKSDYLATGRQIWFGDWAIF